MDVDKDGIIQDTNSAITEEVSINTLLVSVTGHDIKPPASLPSRCNPERPSAFRLFPKHRSCRLLRTKFGLFGRRWWG